MSVMTIFTCDILTTDTRWAGQGAGQLRPAAHLRRASWKLTACAHWSAPHGVYSALYTVQHVVVCTLYRVSLVSGSGDYVT